MTLFRAPSIAVSHPPPSPTAGLILAGGRGRRLAGGAPGGKAALSVAGRSFLAHVATALRAVVDEVVVVATPDTVLPTDAGALAVVHDRTPGAGPLTALADGVEWIATAARAEAVVVVAVDMPLLTPDLPRWLLERLAEPAAGGERPWWVVPWVDGHPQVLASALRPALLPSLRAFLATGRRDLRGYLAMLQGLTPPRVRVEDATAGGMPPAVEAFLDVDEPADVDRLAGAWKRRGAAGI